MAGENDTVRRKMLVFDPQELRRIPCTVCSHKANGFHYGAHTCAACKIFFKRSVGRNLQHKCGNIEAEKAGRVYISRNKIQDCPRCRLEQCLIAGMSIKGSKKGRYNFVRKQEYIARSRELANDVSNIPVQNMGSKIDFSRVSVEFKEHFTNPSSRVETNVSEPNEKDSSGLSATVKKNLPNPSSNVNKNLLNPLPDGSTDFYNSSSDDFRSFLNFKQNEMERWRSNNLAVVPSYAVQSVPLPVPILHLELNHLEGKFYHLNQMSGTFPPDFFHKLPQRQREYLEYKDSLRAIVGSDGPLPIEDYASIYQDTGIDIDGRLGDLQTRVDSWIRRLQSYFKFMMQIPGFQNIPTVDKVALARASKSVFAALSEYRCYDPVNGLYTLPEGVTQDKAQLQSQTPPQYMEHLFKRVAVMQSLRLTEFEEHLLKTISLFNPDHCLTVEGARETAKHREFYIQMLDYASLRRYGYSAVPKLLKVLKMLQMSIDENCAHLREFHNKISEAIGSNVLHFVIESSKVNRQLVALSDWFKTSQYL